MELPVVFIPVRTCATEHARFRLIVTGDCAHEVGRAIDDLVGIDIQLKWLLPVLGDLIEHVLVMTGRIWHGALGLAFPGTKDGFHGLRRGRYRGEEESQENEIRSSHRNSEMHMISEGWP